MFLVEGVVLSLDLTAMVFGITTANVVPLCVVFDIRIAWTAGAHLVFNAPFPIPSPVPSCFLLAGPCGAC